MMEERLAKRYPMSLIFYNLKTGETNVCHRGTDWLGHLQFSPTDPTLLMFCHEGPWHKVDRIWTIRADGSDLKLMHQRTMTMEIAGHEFWSADGQTIWYDLQTPRGEVFWLAGCALATGARTWFHLQRDEWGVHFNVSPDGQLFSSDGGDDQMVAHAPDGKWLYLFHPELIEDRSGGQRGHQQAHQSRRVPFREARQHGAARLCAGTERHVFAGPEMAHLPQQPERREPGLCGGAGQTTADRKQAAPDRSVTVRSLS